MDAEGGRQRNEGEGGAACDLESGEVKEERNEEEESNGTFRERW